MLLSVECPRYGPLPGGSQAETAATTAIVDGGDCEKHSGAFDENSYHDDVHPTTIAGRWFRDNRAYCGRPVIPTLRAKFGLSALQAVQAIRVANGGAS
jgi:hypothetical protein